MMVDAQLTCNLATCAKKLNNQVFVTSCSHIFCVEHLPTMVGNDTRNACIACGTHFQNELDYVQVDLNPNEQYKSMLLMGLNPDQIMEIANRAIGFFIYQLSYIHKNRENVLKRIREHNNELKHYCSSLTAKFKADLQKEQRKTESLKHELEQKMKELEIQEQHILQYKKSNKKLQMQFESQKREIINMRAVSADNTFVPHSNFNGGMKLRPRLQTPLNVPGIPNAHNNYFNGAFGGSSRFGN